MTLFTCNICNRLCEKVGDWTDWTNVEKICTHCANKKENLEAKLQNLIERKGMF